MVLLDSQVIYLSGQKVRMMCLFWLEGHIGVWGSVKSLWDSGNSPSCPSLAVLSFEAGKHSAFIPTFPGSFPRAYSVRKKWPLVGPTLSIGLSRLCFSFSFIFPRGPLLSSREYDEHSSPAFRWSYHIYFLPTSPSLVREAIISQ